MFSVMNCIKRTVPLVENKNIDILVIQESRQKYLLDMCKIPNVTVYSYFNNLVHKAPMPENLVIISDLDNVFSTAFDYIICVGKTNSTHISNVLRERFSSSVILLNDTTEETYCNRPFGTNVSNRIPSYYDTKVSIYPNICEESVTIPTTLTDTTFIQKDQQFCLFDRLEKPVLNRYSGALKDVNCLTFSEENLLRSRVFIDTVVGITEHLIKAIQNNCFPVCPYSKEVQDLIEGNGLIYNDLQELTRHIETIKDKETFNTLSPDKYSISEDEFVKSWEEVLRGQ